MKKVTPGCITGIKENSYKAARGQGDAERPGRWQIPVGNYLSTKPGSSTWILHTLKILPKQRPCEYTKNRIVHFKWVNYFNKGDFLYRHAVEIKKVSDIQNLEELIMSRTTQWETPMGVLQAEGDDTGWKQESALKMNTTRNDNGTGRYLWLFLLKMAYCFKQQQQQWSTELKTHVKGKHKKAAERLGGETRTYTIFSFLYHKSGTRQ